IGRVLVSWIVRVAQEGALFQKLEARGLHLLAQKGLLDPMQRAGFGNAGVRPAGMIGDHEMTAGLERAENRAIQRSTIDAKMAEVVIVEHQRHEVEFSFRKLGRNGVLERTRHGNDRCCRNTGALQTAVTIGKPHRRWPWGSLWLRRRRDRR